MKKRENEIYHFIISYIQAHGYPPSVREIADGLHIKSSSTIHLHLQNMIQNGYLESDAAPGTPRALRVPGWKFVPESESDHSILDKKESDENCPIDTTPCLDWEIDQLQLSNRTYNSLKRSGIHTVRQLSARTKEDIRCIKGMGKMSRKELLDKLAYYQISLKKDW